MTNWRDQILSEFTPSVARLTLVADPDGLLLEEGVFSTIRERNFELITLDDPIGFRYAYESKFRSPWERHEQSDLVVRLDSEARDLNCLPYDLLQIGRKLSFSLDEIFPKLSYPIVAALDPNTLDTLYDAQKQHAPDAPGENTTKDFVLRHVFDIAPELIKVPSDLLRILLRLHYREQRLPSVLKERLIQLLRQRPLFKTWPLEGVVSDRQAFFAFLQERWPFFLDRSANEEGLCVREPAVPYALEFSGPTDLPFDHDDIRVYIDNLFLEGLLEAVPYEQAESLSKPWLVIGIRRDEQADRERRMDGLLCTLATTVPNEDARHDDWFHFARTWAELIVLTLDSDTVLPVPARKKMEGLQAHVDVAITAWLTRRYAGLVKLPPVPPVMLHHIPRFLSRYINDDKNHKVALVLVDGLSLDQWIVIRKELEKDRPNYRFRENAVIAWIPTLTSVSRQAAFAGKPPFYFPDSLHKTDKEPSLWARFWVDQGLSQQEVTYARGLGDGRLETVEEIVAGAMTRVIGLVVDKVDRIMHGMELGAAGMHNQVRQWVRQGFIANLVDLLQDNGFRVYLTSDHGNIEAVGCGRPDEGAVADVRGQRTRIYPDPLLRCQVKKRFPSALEWDPVGLPDGYLPLLAPGRTAFVRESERIVSHGGASLEELVVPLVQIERRDA